MMTVPMDSAVAPSPRELAQRLFKKNAELESRLRRSAQSKVPSDPNIWLQMRENYEKIILTDHDFSETHEIEYLLWQLHYKRIEEFRAHISSAASSSAAASGSGASQGGKNNVNTDRIKRIKSTFRSFLSEATGFYHDLMLKIRSNYGLPLGYFSEGPENTNVPVKDDKRTIEVKKGLMSCHRCLIYLGDLARYKGLYGDGDSASREYAAASSYYKEAASLWPSSGNPHHQLAILASYTSDEVTAVYRYFRSLAVDTPFSTARDNLIIAFEKNRQSYAQLPSNNRVASARKLPPRSAGRGKGRGETRFQPKDANTEPTLKEREYSIPEILKAFCVRFVRLNGILFTRTSLETFGELFSSVSNDLQTLLSSGPEEELNFSSDAAENVLAVVRLIAILIFTVHNVKKESDSQSYVEIVQRTVLLQNAFTAAFEFVGCILKRCIELHDVASSTYLPAILVYIEWLACHPDLAAGSEMEEKQANARSFFWNQCVSFMNKLILTGLAPVDGDDDETCFFDMGIYEEGETGNRLALLEDFELRGFLPLVPAQVILDFSSKHTFGSDGSTREKKARVQRILAAGKALMNFVQIDQLKIYFDPSSKKFVMATEPPVFEASIPLGSSNALEMNAIQQEHQVASRIDSGVQHSATANLGVLQSKAQLYAEGEEDEEIVFKPTVSEKFPRVASEPSTDKFIQPVQMSAAGWPTNGGSIALQSNESASTASDYIQSLPMSSIDWAANGGQQVVPSVAPRPTGNEFIQPVEMSASSWASNGGPLVGPRNTIQMPTFSNVIPDLRTSAPLLPHYSSPDTSRWLLEQEAFLMSGLKNVNIAENGFLEQRLQGGLSGLQSMAYPPQISVEAGLNNMSSIRNQVKADEITIPSALDSVVPSVASSDGTSMKFVEALPAMSKKNPVSRPARHVGPPPGFNYVPSKRQDDSISSVGKGQHPQVDDYSWLDGYQSSLDHVNPPGFMYPNLTATGNAFNGTTSFPFPGKKVSGVHTQVTNEKKWQDFHLFEPAKQYSEQKIQQENQQHGLLPEQQPAQSIWSGRYFV